MAFLIRSLVLTVCLHVAAPTNNELNPDVLGYGSNISGWEPFFVPSYESRFYQSPHLQPNWIPASGSSCTIVSLENYTSWDEIGIENSGGIFLFEPGDYRDWGHLNIRVDGTVIAYRNTSIDGPDLDQNVILPEITIHNVDNVTLQHVTIRGSGNESSIPPIVKYGLRAGSAKSGQIPMCNHLFMNGIICERITGSCMRVYGSYNILQKSILRDKVHGNGDRSGIGFYAAPNQTSASNKVLNCEISNLSDCVGIPYDDAYSGSCPGTIIEGNDCYITEELYVTTPNGTLACAEDGVDIKNGGDYASSIPSFVTNNRFWGFRPTDQSCGGSGSTGAGFIFHRMATNWIVRHNIFMDLAHGGVVKDQKPGTNEQVQNITIHNNVWFKLVDALPVITRANGETGPNPNSGLWLTVMANDTVIDNNSVIIAKSLLNTKVDDLALTNNVFVDCPLYSGPGNNINGTRDSYGKYKIFLKQWTGPELIRFPAPTETEHP